MQAFVNGVFVAEAPSAVRAVLRADDGRPRPAPGTGRGPGAPLTLGVACLAVGLIVLASTRRREDRTPVRS